MTNEIIKTIDLEASPARVWQALTDSREFGAWFRMAIDGPFVLDKTVRGKRLDPMQGNGPWSATPVKIAPETEFCFTWHPFTHDSGIDYDAEAQTLVEFRLQTIAAGTRLTVRESGFEALPANRRKPAFTAHEQGWPMVMQWLADYLKTTQS